MIQVRKVSGNLYERYPGQSQPQDSFIELDCRTSKLTARVNPEVGNAIPYSVHHGHVQRWCIPSLKARAANELLAEIEPFARVVVAGYSSVWDGHNHVAEFSDAAEDAGEVVEKMCDEISEDHGEAECVCVWDAADWFDGHGNKRVQAQYLGISAETTDEQLDALVDVEMQRARDEGVDELEGLRHHLETLRAAGE